MFKSTLDTHENPREVGPLHAGTLHAGNKKERLHLAEFRMPRINVGNES
mgnify:CR=1 FL=1